MKSLANWKKIPGANSYLTPPAASSTAGNNILRRLRRQLTVVYLAASANEQELLIQRYLEDPKPVLWRGAFQPKPGETPRDTVARCFRR